MSVFESITRKVADTARLAARRSGDLVEVTKFNMNIGCEEEKIQKVFAEIGKAVYEGYNRGEDKGESLNAYCEKIKMHEENIKEIKQKILELKNVKACQSCEAELELDMAYCPRCGTKQEIPQPPVEEPTEKTCQICSSINAIDYCFCFKCGTKFE